MEETDLVMEPMSETITVSNTLSIPGLSFRRFRGESDFSILTNVIQRSRDADLFDLVETPEDIANDFRHIQNCDPGEDMFFVEVNGTAVGFCRCQWHERSGGVRTYNHFEHLVPECRGRGLRLMMLRENERRLREIAKSHPREYSKFFEVVTNSGENHLKSLVEEEGYRPFRYDFLMVRPNLNDIPDLPLPEGLVVRPVEPAHYQIILDAEKEAFLEEPHFAEEIWTEKGAEGLLGMPEFRPEIWQVAWDGDKVAGAVLNFIFPEENKKLNRNWGWTGGIFVGRLYRNHGLASALIARSFEVLKKEGASEAALFVDSDNPSGANRLYERMGFRLHSQYTVYRKTLD
jgi:mycothiol synthase